jgi:hypothetical protein
MLSSRTFRAASPVDEVDLSPDTPTPTGAHPRETFVLTRHP